MFKTKDVEKIKTHVLLCSTNIFSKNHIIYEIMWEETVELDRTQMTVWGMNIQCWLTSYRHALRICNNLLFLCNSGYMNAS